MSKVLKGTVGVILSDPSFKARHVQLTRVTFEPLYLSYNEEDIVVFSVLSFYDFLHCLCTIKKKGIARREPFGGWRRSLEFSRMPARWTSGRSARPPSLS